MEEFKDIDELVDDRPRTSQVKKTMLEEFSKAFLRKILCQFTQEDGRFLFEEVLGGGDTFINKGYFISRNTLDLLRNSISAEDGGVWINFGLGLTIDRVNEIQLVFTAVDSAEEIDDESIGNLCFTTAVINTNVDPPYTGVPSPKSGK